MINRNHLAASEAIFGSAARGTLDHLSDQDYLIVEDDPIRRSRRKAMLEHQGWSVASYSWSRLKALIDKGALFAQHLKQEALIVRDVGDQLKHELALFVPKFSYGNEIEETVKLITSATSSVNTAMERAWASDVLAVAVRNLAIMTLADRGKYLFDYDTVVSCFADIKQLSTFERQLLRRLRYYKSCYRSGGLNSILPNRHFEMICSILAKASNGSHFSDFGGRNPFSYPDRLGPYVSQRLVERDLISGVPLPDTDRRQYAQVSARVMKKLVKPRDYGWEFSNPKSRVWRDVEWLDSNTRLKGPRAVEEIAPKLAIASSWVANKPLLEQALSSSQGR